MLDVNSDIRKCLVESAFATYSNSEMGDIVASGKIEYKGKVTKEFVQRALWNDQSTWYVIEDPWGNIEAAITAVEVDGSLLIEEFMSLKKGAGSELLLHVLSFDYNMIYLFADWSQKDSLLDYYRDEKFGLEEKVMYNSKNHDTHYFFKNKKLSPDQLEKFINKNFVV